MAKTKPENETETTADASQASESKPVRVKYTGPIVHRRILTAEDAKKVGIEGFSKTVWDRDNNHTAEITDPEVVKWLTEGQLKDSFKVLQPGQTD